MQIKKLFRKIIKSRALKKAFFVVKAVWFFFAALLIVFFFAFIYFTKDLPRPEDFAERQINQSTQIFDRTGTRLLYEMYGEEKREVVSLSLIPAHLQKAVIAAEDATFYTNIGLDFKGLLRAVFADIKSGRPSQGGSTITQQLVRSSFLTQEKTLKRKVREIILTLELSRRYSKEQILEWYLNQIPFGSNSYGVEAASKTFFAKSVKDISLSEAAILASLIRAPSHLSPYGLYKQELLNRKDYVLDRMAKLGYISQEAAENAKKEEVVFVKNTQRILAPHFVLYVKDYLETKYGEDFLKERGLKIYTSLDWDLQQLAETVVKEGVERNKPFNAHNGALAAINPNNGEILAMVGSKDWFADPYPKNCDPGKTCLFDPKYNVAAPGPNELGRQPGSAFKPFVYATAFKKGYNDNYVVIDEETNFGVWGGKPYIPQNYDGRFRGPVTLRQALAQSLNVPSVKVLAYLAGLEDSIQTAKDMGVTTLNNPASFYGLSIVLGGGEVKLLDMAAAYGVFATRGLRAPQAAVLKIEDRQGNLIEENKKTATRVLGANVTELINSILSDNEARAPVFGATSALYIENYKVAVKTGTTQDFRDGWTIGYTPSIAVGVWVGNNNNAPMGEIPAASSGAPIWKAFMEKFLLKYPEDFNSTP